MSDGSSNNGNRGDTLAVLQFQLQSLQNRVLENRVKDLEVENAKLLSRVTGCKCKQMDENNDASVSNGKSSVQIVKEVKAGGDKYIKREILRKRYIALKVMYFGQRFYGFASEAQMDPTIESEIFKALKKTQLLVGDKKESRYSRCGRTDKGVSSVGQVIALYVRSRHCFGENISTPTGGQTEGEIDYVKVLNRALPDDIRIMGWCPVPLDFSARFSCLSREYKYFFWRDSLNLLAMENAGKKFVGEHDFRNFCKMDAANVHNYKRRVTSFEISPCQKSWEGKELFAITIKGSAFLWHQVRCMVAVLFMVGQGVESIDVIDALLDTDEMLRKPQYAMASEIPLVLQSCNFEDLEFICSADASQALHAHLKNEWLSYQLQSAIFYEALLSCLAVTDDGNLSDNVRRKKKPSHVPLLSRPVEPSYEERRAKIDLKK